MKLRIWAFIMCLALSVAVFSGCGLKKPTTSDASPSGSDDGTSVSGTDSAASAGGATATGIVSAIDGKTITLELVKPYDSAASGDTAANNLIASGSSLFSLTGAKQSVTVSDSTAVILENLGYTAGSFSDIAEGDFLAAAVNGSIVIALIDNGQSKDYSNPAGSSSSPSSSGSEADATDTSSSDSSSGTAPVVPSGNGQGSSTSGDDTASTSTPDNGTPSSSQTTGDTSSLKSGTFTVTMDQLKVRSGPAMSFSVLGTLAKGTKITGTEVGNDWFKFTYNGKTAYCSAVYLASANSSGSAAAGSQPTSGVPDSSKSVSYTVTEDQLKVRSSPDTTASILGKLAKGTKVTGTVSKGWLKFTYSGKTGYCSALYLAAG